MTFDTHPLKVLRPARAPRLLTSTPHKLRLLAALDVEGCLVIPFTVALARQTPVQFVSLLARSAPTLRHIVVGGNWTFGRRGCGTPARLARLAAAHGITVAAVPPIAWRRRPVSSTRIRAAVEAGKLRDAAAMLGRPFSLLGTVVPGHRLGRKLGFPTANLDPHNEVAPPNGVYAVRARWRGADYPGLVNIGVRPTVTGTDVRSRGARPPPRVIELHLLGIRRRLYGRTIEVSFLRRLRAERRFPSLAALQRQIRADTRAAERWFGITPKNPRGTPCAPGAFPLASRRGAGAQRGGCRQGGQACGAVFFKVRTPAKIGLYNRRARPYSTLQTLKGRTVGHGTINQRSGQKRVPAPREGQRVGRGTDRLVVPEDRQADGAPQGQQTGPELPVRPDQDGQRPAQATGLPGAHQ